MQPLLDVRELRTYFDTWAGEVKAVDNVTFQVGESESVGLVGESGSGKTVTALSVMRIVPPPGRIVGGSIHLRGHDLLAKSETEMQQIRGRIMSYIFQDPATLDPLFSVGEQLAEVIRLHQKVHKKEAAKRAEELLRTVEIADPEIRTKQYPHQLSGGMKQRIAVARALASAPSFLIADEPTTSLDATIQAQVLDLMTGLTRRLGMSILHITHDLGVVANSCDRVVIVYAGQVAESGTSKQIFTHPKHPYTEALLAAIPRFDFRTEELPVVPGNIPNPIDPPAGCRFHPRCPYAKKICAMEVPKLEEVEPDHWVACHRASDLSLRPYQEA